MTIEAERIAKGKSARQEVIDRAYGFTDEAIEAVRRAYTPATGREVAAALRAQENRDEV